MITGEQQVDALNAHLLSRQYHNAAPRIVSEVADKLTAEKFKMLLASEKGDDLLLWLAPEAIATEQVGTNRDVITLTIRLVMSAPTRGTALRTSLAMHDWLREGLRLNPNLGGLVIASRLSPDEDFRRGDFPFARRTTLTGGVELRFEATAP